MLYAERIFFYNHIIHIFVDSIKSNTELVDFDGFFIFAFDSTQVGLCLKTKHQRLLSTV
jgi:hypothetical protein